MMLIHDLALIPIWDIIVVCDIEIEEGQTIGRNYLYLYEGAKGCVNAIVDGKWKRTKDYIGDDVC